MVVKFADYRTEQTGQYPARLLSVWRDHTTYTSLSRWLKRRAGAPDILFTSLATFPISFSELTLRGNIREVTRPGSKQPSLR
jgi:hypothetical protein